VFFAPKLPERQLCPTGIGRILGVLLGQSLLVPMNYDVSLSERFDLVDAAYAETSVETQKNASNSRRMKIEVR
jgi:hypothetical protein